MAGGDSTQVSSSKITCWFWLILWILFSQLYSPLFETDVRDTMQYWGSIYVVYLLGLIISSFLIHLGIKTFTRGWLLPWLIQMFIIIIFQFLWGIWQLYGYYIYVSFNWRFSDDLNKFKFLVIFQLIQTFYCLVNWLWMGFNVSS